MGLIKDNFKEYKKASEPLYKTPQSIQQTLEIIKVSKSGLFEVAPNYYSKCFEFSDINYVTESEEGQFNILDFYGKFLNSIDYDLKLVIVNEPKNMQELRKNVLFQPVDDGFNKYRNIMNHHIENKIEDGRKGVEQKKYICASIKANSFEHAKDQFITIQGNIESEFQKLHSTIHCLNCEERLELLRRIYQIGAVNNTPIKFDEYVKMGKDFKNDVVNYKKTTYRNNDFQIDDMYCKTMFIQTYPNSLSDTFFNELITLPIYSLISVDIVPIPKDVAIKKLESIYMGIETKIINQQRKRNANNDFASDISYKVQREKEEIVGQMDDVKGNDQKVFYTGVNITVMAKSQEELNSIQRTIKTLGNKYGCKIADQYLKQREAFNTTLPIGVRQVSNLRSMQTGSIAGLMPFYVQELQFNSPNVYYGVNQVSKNVLLGDRKRLQNGNGFYFGGSGSGKSFKVKEEIESIFLNTKDDILIVDPQNEYFDMAERFNGTIINLSNNSKYYLNPMDVDLTQIDLLDSKGIVREKSEFLLGLCEQCMGAEKFHSLIGAKSIISRCTSLVYEEIAKLDVDVRKQPTLSDFYEILKVQPETEAGIIALELEVFITGSLNLFNHQTNVDSDNRLMVFGIKELGDKLSPLAMMVMLESIKNRIFKNFEKDVASWLYIDEIHVLMHDQFTIEYVQYLYRTVRKFKGLCSGITQAVVDLTRNPVSKTMISNSEFIVLLKQSANDVEVILDTIEGITEEQIKYVTSAPSGTGLLKHGSIVLPFDSRVDRNDDLYWMNTTNPHEQEEKRLRLQKIDG